MKLFEDNFAPNLVHKLDVIKDQVESGMYTVKRIAQYLKKIVLMLKTNSERRSWLLLRLRY
jgi:hypothetical protein